MEPGAIPVLGMFCFLTIGWMGFGPAGTGGADQAGVVWDRPRKQLQRLGDSCCLRLCADMWSMACFLWTALDRPEPIKDRTKQGREWA
jgi:hypothetical protein